MIKETQKIEIIEGFKAGVEELLERDSLLTSTDPTTLVEDTEAITDYIRKTVRSAVLSALPVGSPLVDPIVRVNVSDNGRGNLLVNVSLSQRKKSPVTFSGSKTFAGESISAAGLVKFFEGVILNALTSLIVSENLEAVNDALALAVQQAELPFSVKFVARDSTTARGFINYISNDEVIFIADTDAAIRRIPKLVLFSDPEDGIVTEEQVDRAKQDLADNLEGIETPVELLKVKVSLIQILAGIGTHSAVTMVRDSVSRKIEGVRPNVKRDIEAVVETPEAIGLVSRVDGVWSEKLAAFDKKTLEPADLDVAAEAERIVSAQ